MRQKRTALESGVGVSPSPLPDITKRHSALMPILAACAYETHGSKIAVRGNAIASRVTTAIPAKPRSDTALWQFMCGYRQSDPA